MKGIQFQNSLAAGTSLLTVLAPKVCCWGGAIAALSSGTSYLAWVYPLRPYLFVLAFLALALSFYKVYRPKRFDAGACNDCPNKKVHFLNSSLWLWMVTAFVLISFLYNYLPQWI